MKKTFWIVDTFTRKQFKGNAAAVVILDVFLDDAALQLIAAQMNLSETAFLVETAPLAYRLRWFTPTVEVPLCGHATLAATHVLHKTGRAAIGDTVRYQTLSGELSATITKDAIELDFPLLPGEPAKTPPALKYLETSFTECWRNGSDYLVEVKDYETLVACKPWFKKLAQLGETGVIVTTNKGVPAGFDFASRYFVPGAGIDEDPVTGSVHCFLAPYWQKKLGKAHFRAYQASTGEGELDVRIDGECVKIAGQTITTLKGELSLPTRKGKAA